MLQGQSDCTVSNIDMPWLYWGRAQDVIQETKQSQVRPSNQMLLSFLPFPVRHPGADHGILTPSKGQLLAELDP